MQEVKEQELEILNAKGIGYYGLGENVHIAKQVRFRAKPDSSDKTQLFGIPKEQPEHIVAMALRIAKELYTKDSIGESIIYVHELMEQTYNERGDNPKDLVVDTESLFEFYQIKENINYVSVGEIHIGTRPWGTLKMSTHSSVGIKSSNGNADMFILYILWYAVHVFKRNQILELLDRI